MSFFCRIQLLGGLRVEIAQRRISHFQTRKTAALLAFLAYHLHQAHPRELLIELLWPDCTPDAGRNRLSTALSTLRRELETPEGPGIFLADRFHVQLDPAVVTTDVLEFETLL